MQGLYREFTVALVAAGLTVVWGSVIATENSEELRLGNEAFNRGDLIAAMAYYRSASERGVADAQVRLAWILDQAEENEQAVEWYRKAAEQNSADGQAGLAQMYAKGEGIGKDPEAALRLFEQAASAGHKGAMSILSTAYRSGELGVEPDSRQAALWAAKLEAAETAGADTAARKE